jgi:glycosyltransferase involved in cell wall biosynthesis
VLTASVIIRTRNDHRSLKGTLERVFEQQPAPLEVIVVDAGSTDRTLAIADTSDALVLTLSPEDWGCARALNRAARVARGDVLVLLSAHCRPVGDDWLGRLLSHFDDPTVAAAWGPALGPGEATSSGPPTWQLPGSYTRATWAHGLSGDNGAVRASLWQRQPFDERYPALEDKQWAQVMMGRGFRTVHDPAATVRYDRRGNRAAFELRLLAAENLARMFPGVGPEPPASGSGSGVFGGVRAG